MLCPSRKSFSLRYCCDGAYVGATSVGSRWVCIAVLCSGCWKIRDLKLSTGSDFVAEESVCSRSEFRDVKVCWLTVSAVEA